jgi:hypothetical protein
MTVESNNPSDTAQAFCAWCGGQLVRSARFCPGCGEATGGTATVPDTPPADWLAEEMDKRSVEPPSDVEETLPLWESAAEVVGDEPVPARRIPRPSRRWMIVGAAATALLLVAIVGSTFGFRYLQDRPVHEAFDGAQQVFSPMAQSFAEASDLEQVGFAGQRAEEAVDRLTSRRTVIVAADTELARSMVPVIDAQVAAAQAGALLAGVDSDLKIWGGAHEAMATALEDLAAAAEVLAVQDAESAGAVFGGDALLSNLEEVVGTAIAEETEAALQAVLADLTTARNTSDVRAVAEDSARDAQSAEAAMEGMAVGSQEAEQLESSLGIYRAVAGLDLLDGETLGDWPSMRQSITVALGAVPASSPLVSDGREAVRSLNRLVTRAGNKLSDWQAQYDAAVATKAADTSAMEEYAAAMEAAMRRYSTLRSDLSGWIDRVESPSAYVTYDEAYSVLSQAQWDRQTIRDEMNGLAVPDDVRSAHAELVGVVDDAIAAMQAAYDGATDSDYCITSCYYKDTPGWKQFSSESGRITDAYRAADQNWQAAVTAAKGGIEARKLPRKPQV